MQPHLLHTLAHGSQPVSNTEKDVRQVTAAQGAIKDDGSYAPSNLQHPNAQLAHPPSLRHHPASLQDVLQPSTVMSLSLLPASNSTASACAAQANRDSSLMSQTYCHGLAGTGVAVVRNSNTPGRESGLDEAFCISVLAHDVDMDAPGEDSLQVLRCFNPTTNIKVQPHGPDSQGTDGLTGGAFPHRRPPRRVRERGVSSVGGGSGGVSGDSVRRDDFSGENVGCDGGDMSCGGAGTVSDDDVMELPGGNFTAQPETSQSDVYRLGQNASIVPSSVASPNVLQQALSPDNPHSNSLHLGAEPYVSAVGICMPSIYRPVSTAQQGGGTVAVKLSECVQHACMLSPAGGPETRQAESQTDESHVQHGRQ